MSLPSFSTSGIGSASLSSVRVEPDPELDHRCCWSCLDACSVWLTALGRWQPKGESEEDKLVIGSV